MTDLESLASVMNTAMELHAHSGGQSNLVVNNIGM